MNKKFFILLIIILMISLFSLIIYNIINRIGKSNNNNKNIETIKTFSNGKNNSETNNNESSENNQLEIENNKNLVEPEIMSYYKGYPVIAKLEIPKIHLETDILKDYSEEALQISVTKFYKGNPNQVGNFCVAGHNYITSNMFHYLKDLEISDTLYLTDAIFGKKKYEIYDKKIVNPKDISCLSQETNGNIELTLITCTSDSKNRIIIKAVNI